MITSNILQRVFRLRAGKKHGTGFAIPWNGYTYMVTAKHIFDGSPIDKFDLLQAGTWSIVPIPVITESHYDIAVMRMPEIFEPGNTIIVSDKGVFLSEDVYMLGYPLDLYHDASMNPPSLNHYFPLPLVSKGCLAAIPGIGSPVEGGMIVSGQIDCGFSGGPIVAVRDPNSPMVIGVISYNLRQKTEATFKAGDKILISHPANLVVGYAISVVTALIDAHFDH